MHTPPGLLTNATFAALSPEGQRDHLACRELVLKAIERKRREAEAAWLRECAARRAEHTEGALA